jgi:hypothetical protein
MPGIIRCHGIEFDSTTISLAGGTEVKIWPLSSVAPSVTAYNNRAAIRAEEMRITDPTTTHRHRKLLRIRLITALTGLGKNCL